MQVVDGIGLAHLQGIMALKEDQEKILHETVELVQDGKVQEAEHAASCSPGVGIQDAYAANHIITNIICMTDQ